MLIPPLSLLLNQPTSDSTASSNQTEKPVQSRKSKKAKAAKKTTTPKPQTPTTTKAQVKEEKETTEKKSKWYLYFVDLLASIFGFLDINKSGLGKAVSTTIENFGKVFNPYKKASFADDNG